MGKLKINLTPLVATEKTHYGDIRYVCFPILSKGQKLGGPFVITVLYEEWTHEDRLTERSGNSSTYSGDSDIVIDKIKKLKLFKKDTEIELEYNRLEIKNR